MKTRKFFRFKLAFLLLASVLVLSGCMEKTSFKKGDIKDDFCGAHINFQYCKCAFHNDYCDNIGMSKGEAKRYVNEEYDKWTETAFEDFKSECLMSNGYMKGKNCVTCGIDQEVSGSKCVAIGSGEEEDDIDMEEDEDVDSDGEEGECKYDSDCDPICDGDVMWKMGCNARTNTCERTFDTNCASDVETFGDLSFPKICSEGTCVRDADTIAKTRAELEAEKKLWSDAVKDMNSARDGIRDAMMDANKNCINGIADMTNVAIIEFSTRIASVLAGGIPDIAAMTASAADKAAGLMGEHVKNLAGAAVDYAGEALNRLYNYQNGEPVEEEKKLKPHEYIKLNCDLYEYFKGVQAESDTELETALQNARDVDSLLQALP